MSEDRAEIDGSEVTDGEASLLADDDFYRALASVRRRRMLALLLEGDPRSTAELATLLAGWDASDEEAATSAAERDRIRIDLRHVHLPILDEVGLVEYDRDREVVAPEPIPDPVGDLVFRSVADDPAASN